MALLEKAVGKLVDKFGVDVELGWDAATTFTYGASTKQNSTLKT